MQVKIDILFFVSIAHNTEQATKDKILVFK